MAISPKKARFVDDTNSVMSNVFPEKRKNSEMLFNRYPRKRLAFEDKTIEIDSPPMPMGKDGIPAHHADGKLDDHGKYGGAYRKCDHACKFDPATSVVPGVYERAKRRVRRTAAGKIPGNTFLRNRRRSFRKRNGRNLFSVRIIRSFPKSSDMYMKRRSCGPERTVMMISWMSG